MPSVATRQHSRAKSWALRVVHRAEDAQNTVRKSTKRQPMPAMPIANICQHMPTYANICQHVSSEKTWYPLPKASFLSHLSPKQTLRLHFSGRPVSQCYGTHECFVFRLHSGALVQKGETGIPWDTMGYQMDKCSQINLILRRIQTSDGTHIFVWKWTEDGCRMGQIQNYS